MENKLFPPASTAVKSLDVLYTPEFFKQRIQGNLPDHIYQILSVQSKIQDEEQRKQIIAQIWAEQRAYDKALIDEMMDRQENPHLYRSEEMNQ